MTVLSQAEELRQADDEADRRKKRDQEADEMTAQLLADDPEAERIVQVQRIAYVELLQSYLSCV